MTIDSFSRPPGNFPSGVIIPWFQGYHQVPNGWVVCDGNNGTPNLINRFIKSVPNSSTDPGATGGQTTVTLSVSQIPSHNHSATADTAGDHSHEILVNTNLWAEDGGGGLVGGYEYDTSTNGSHSHTIDVSNAGSGDFYWNEPEYYKLIFIQRL